MPSTVHPSILRQLGMKHMCCALPCVCVLDGLKVDDVQVLPVLLLPSNSLNQSNYVIGTLYLFYQLGLPQELCPHHSFASSLYRVAMEFMQIRQSGPVYDFARLKMAH